MDATWDRIAALVNGVVAGGLRGPADPAQLAEVPASWRPLWARHDGQTDAVANLFLGYFFLPLQGPDSVESEVETLPDGYLPIAKDFGGSYLAIDVGSGRVVSLGDDGDNTELAEGPDAFLVKVLSHLERHPPEAWVERDGRRVPASRRLVDLAELADWQVGETRDLGEGLVMVRIASPDPAPFAPMGSRIDLAVDHPDDPDARGALVGLELGVPKGPPDTTSDAVAAVGRHGDERWVEATGPIPRLAVLKVELDLGKPVGGPRPLFQARHGEGAARALARLSLGDVEGAHDAAIRTPGVDAVTRARCALGAAEAKKYAEELPVGHRIRVKVFAESEPARALEDLDRWIEQDPEGIAFAWRAQVHERLGSFEAASSDTDRAIQLLSTVRPEVLPGLRAALRRRRARMSAPKVEAPLLEDPTEEAILVDAVPVEQIEGQWRARVEVTPEQAEQGRLVELVFPDGDRGAVRLPKGVGHGLRATVQVGVPVEVVVAVTLPRGWPRVGDNPTLAFDRWDAIATVARWREDVKIVGPDGKLHELQWAKPDRMRVEGAGLARADGSRGDLWVSVRPT